MHRDDVGMKLASLRALSSQHDRVSQAGAARTSVAPDPMRNAGDDPVREFSDRITCELTGTSILRYSRRVALLNRARRLGIDRVDASLLIAAAQDRRDVTDAVTGSTSIAGCATVSVLLQAAILCGAWLIIS